MESTEVQITQKKKGKEKRNSYQKSEEITVGQAHVNTRKLNRNILTNFKSSTYIGPSVGFDSLGVMCLP